MAIALNKRKVKSTAKLKNAKHNEWMWGYILVAPTVIGLLILNIIPLIQTFILSFQKTGDFGFSQWAGFENYKRLFSDPAVWQATGNTLKYVLMVIPFIIIFSLLVAVLLNPELSI